MNALMYFNHIYLQKLKLQTIKSYHVFVDINIYHKDLTI